MSKHLDELLEQVTTTQELTKEDEAHHQKLIHMLEDINELSKYMKQTFGTPYVPMPVSVFSGAQICIKSFVQKGESSLLGFNNDVVLAIRRWSSQDKQEHPFIIRDLKYKTRSPKEVYYYSNITFPDKLLCSEAQSYSNHREIMERKLKELYLHWEDTYKQQTEELIEDLMEDWIEENNPQKQDISM